MRDSLRRAQQRYHLRLKTARGGSRLSNRDWLGLFGEWAVHLTLRAIYPSKAYWDHFTAYDENGVFDASLWKDWTGKNPDAKVLFYIPEKDLLIEVKNNSGTYPLTPEMVRSDIIPRFLSVDSEHKHTWLLIVAHDCFTKGANEELRKYDIARFEIGTTVTEHLETDIPSLTA